MYNNNIDEYWKSKGINGSAYLLNDLDFARSFVKDTYHIVGRTNRASNFSKISCYQTIFPDIKPRHKYTGFENFKSLDARVRDRINKEVFSGLILPGGKKIMVDPSIDQISSKTALRNLVSKNTKNVLLYLSGGLDSEFLARGYLEAGVPFTPVIFQWTDNQNVIQNSFDTDWAMEFCKQWNLIPLVRQFNVEQFWLSNEVYAIAGLADVDSPQLCTYIKMIELMDREMPGHAHIMAGEPRYQIKDNLGIMYSIKSDPPLYSGSLLTGTNSVNSNDSSPVFAYMVFDTSNGTYETAATNNTYNLYYGVWTTTPATTYEIQIVRSSASVANTSSTPTATPNYAWTKLDKGTAKYNISYLSLPRNVVNYAYFTYTFSLRKYNDTNNPVKVVTSTLDLSVNVYPTGGGGGTGGPTDTSGSGITVYPITSEPLVP